MGLGSLLVLPDQVVVRQHQQIFSLVVKNVKIDNFPVVT